MNSYNEVVIKKKEISANKYEEKEVKNFFDQRSESEIEIASMLEEKNKVEKILELENSNNYSRVRSIKKNVTNGNGYVNIKVIFISLILITFITYFLIQIIF